MEDNTFLKQKIHAMIEMMKSERRKRLGRYCDWRLTSKSLLEELFNLRNLSILEKGGRPVCFKIVHEQKCEVQYDCSCEETVADPLITLYYFSDLFTQMISVSHFQLRFSSNMVIRRLSDIIDGINVSSERIKLFDISEAETSIIDGIDSDHGAADDEEFKKEQSPDFQRIRDEFNTLICEYLKLAFTDPTSLPPFLLNSVHEGPTMRLSELIAWLEESE
jgi:hypothetical protein